MTSLDGAGPARLGLRKLAANIAQTLGRQLLALLLALGTTIVIARVLGPAGNGQYAVAMLLPTFLSTLLNLGLAPANVYFVGRHAVALRAAMGVTVRVWLVLAALGVGLGAALIALYGEALFPGVPPPLLWMALLVFPLVLLQGYLASLLQAVQDFRRYNLATVVAPGVMFGLASLLLLLGGGVPAVVVAAAVAQTLGLAATFLLVRPLLAPGPGSVSAEPYEIGAGAYVGRAVQYGYKAHLSNVLTFINYRADLFLVSLLLGPAAVGIYVIAVTIAEKLWLLSQAIGAVTLPRLAELHAEEGTRRQLTPFLARWTLITTALAAAILAALAPWLTGLLFGPAYREAITPLLLLLPGIVAWSLVSVLANDIAARGRPTLNLYNVAVVLVVNIVGNLVLIPRLGLAGAALATSIAYALTCLLEVWIYARVSKHRWYAIFVFGAHDRSLLRQVRHLLSRSSP